MGQAYWTSEAGSFYTFRGVTPEALLKRLVKSWNAEAQERHMVEFWGYANGWRYSLRTFNVIMYYFTVEVLFVEGYDSAVLLIPHADEGATINTWEWSVYQNNLDNVMRSFNAQALPLEIVFSADVVGRHMTQLTEADLDISWQ